MSTNRDIVTAALRMLGVVGATQSPSADDAALALSEMNDLFAEMESDGVDLGYPPQDSLSDDFPLDRNAEAATKSLLAVRLITYFPSQDIPPTLPIQAQEARDRLLREAVLANMEEARPALPLGVRRH